MGGVQKLYVFWGGMNVFLASLLAIYPPGRTEVGLLRLVSFASNIFFILFSTGVLRLPMRLSVGLGMVLLFQAWAVASTILMHEETGRLVQGNAYIHIWLLYFVSLYLACSMFVYAYPGARRIIIWCWAIFAVPSGIIGIAQFLGIMPAIAAIQVSGEGAGRGFRPSGLTIFPSFLSFQGIIGLALVVGRMRVRKLVPWEVLGFLFFSAVVVVAQYRTFYLGLLLLWGLAVMFSLKREGPGALKYVAGAVLLLAIPIIFFPQRFAYALGTQLENDPALEFRAKHSWSQLDYIYEHRPWTGIGADSNLMITASDIAVGHDKWSHYVMDSSYRLILACFGLIGLAIAIIGFLVIMAFLFQTSAEPHESADRSALATAALCVYLIYLISLSTTNFLVYVPPGNQMAFLFAMCARTWIEQAKAQPDLPLHLRIIAWLRARHASRHRGTLVRRAR